ncbi:MAG: VCBS repeat-containing protein [Planctomycetes bacterium]|nr:VCBS repeat-containing protein [Planctomycetota bacterium]MCB9918975.1 VCBS repeat-containing protein [Planctomycetota bacterium]
MSAFSKIVLRNFAVLASLLIVICSGRLATQERARVIEELTAYHDAQFVDVDQDGDLDWLSFGGPNRLELRLNDGLGNFVNASVGRIPVGLLAVGGYPLRMIVRDVTGDGLLDILFPYVLVPGPGLAIGLLENIGNMGNAVFRDVTQTKMPASISGSAVQRFAASDVDGDRDLDLVVSFMGQSAQLWINLGDGKFVNRTSSMMPVSTVAWDILPGDIDGDKDIDLLFIGLSGPFPVLLNDGKGTFTPSQNSSLLTSREWPLDCHLIDVDYDGDLDFLAPTQRGDFLFINDGRGQFKDESHRMPTPAGYGGSAVFVPGDFDGNGSIDFLVSCQALISSYPRHINFLLNDGRGFFTFVASVVRDQGGIHYLVEEGSAGDTDNDGDDDFFVKARPAALWDPVRARTWRNLHRQLFVPQNAQIGKPLTLELHSLLAPSIILPFLAAGDANIRVPGIRGLLRCDPATTVALGAIAVTTPGKVLPSLPIPNNPKLLGLEFSVQALIIDAKQPRPIGFTNPVTKTIKR